jgi:hypothetical protein
MRSCYLNREHVTNGRLAKTGGWSKWAVEMGSCYKNGQLAKRSAGKKDGWQKGGWRKRAVGRRQAVGRNESSEGSLVPSIYPDQNKQAIPS